MTCSLSRLRFCLPALVGILMLLGMLCSTASAEEWGELAHTHFRIGPEAGEIEFTSASSVLAFAADSSDRDFYVGDEPKRGEYRVQRFDSAGTGEASISFTPPSAKKTGAFNSEGLQIAVDPARNRVYALVLYRRRTPDEAEENARVKEEEKLEKEGKQCGPGTCYERLPLDSEELAAGDLYAFEYTGGKLVSVKTGAEGPEPIIGETGFKAQGEEPKEALLNPRGLAVEPATGNLAFLGVQDEEADAAVEKEEAEKQCRAAAQFVTFSEKTGKLTGGKLAARFADTADALSPDEKNCEPGEQAEVPVSPVFTPGGNLLFSSGAENEGSIWEILTPSAEAAEHKEIEAHPKRLFAEGEIAPLLEILPPESGAGPSMSFIAEGPASGRIYLASKYQINFAALLTLQYVGESGGEPAHVSEIGWSAGGEGASCNIPQPFGQSILLGAFNEGAGKEGVTVFDAFAEEITKAPRIEDFAYGLGGSTTGCPKPVLTSPAAAVGENNNAHEAPVGENVILSSGLSGANAKSVEWKFKYKNPNTHEEGTETVNAGYQVEESKLEYKFTHAAEYEITEIVHTDDLAHQEVAAPEVLKLTATPKPIGIKVVAPAKAVPANEEEAGFEATITDLNETPLNLKKVVWSFGDGSQPVETKGAPGETKLKIDHTFISRCGGKCTVSLTVEDTAGATKTATVSVSVSESKAEEAARKAKEAKEAEEAQRKAETEAQHKAEAEAAQHKAEAEAAQHKAEEEAAAKKHQEEEAAAKRKAEEEAAKKHVLGVKEAPPTRAQLLAKALKQCKKEKPQSKRAKCDAAAKKKYGPKKKTKKKKKKK